MFNNFYYQYLALLTMAPRNRWYFVYSYTRHQACDMIRQEKKTPQKWRIPFCGRGRCID